MMINEIFKNNEVEVIRRAINELPIENCIERFIDYIDLAISEKTKAFGPTEKIYVEELKNNMEELIADIIVAKSCEHLSREELLKNIHTYFLEGIWSLDDRDYNELYEELRSYSNAFCHAHIVKYMNRILDETIVKARETELDREIKSLESRIESIKKNIKDGQARLAETEKELEMKKLSK